jgi:hypothetical protein
MRSAHDPFHKQVFWKWFLWSRCTSPLTRKRLCPADILYYDGSKGVAETPLIALLLDCIDRKEYAKLMKAIERSHFHRDMPFTKLSKEWPNGSEEVTLLGYAASKGDAACVRMLIGDGAAQNCAWPTAPPVHRQPWMEGVRHADDTEPIMSIDTDDEETESIDERRGKPHRTAMDLAVEHISTAPPHTAHDTFGPMQELLRCGASVSYALTRQVIEMPGPELAVDVLRMIHSYPHVNLESLRDNIGSERLLEPVFVEACDRWRHGATDGGPGYANMAMFFIGDVYRHRLNGMSYRGEDILLDFITSYAAILECPNWAPVVGALRCAGAGMTPTVCMAVIENVKICDEVALQFIGACRREDLRRDYTMLKASVDAGRGSPLLTYLVWKGCRLSEQQRVRLGPPALAPLPSDLMTPLSL